MGNVIFGVSVWLIYFNKSSDVLNIDIDLNFNEVSRYLKSISSLRLRNKGWEHNFENGL